MVDWARALVLAALRVPAEPHPPEGSAESLVVFRAGKNFYYWQLFLWAIKIFGVVVGVLVAYGITWKFVKTAPIWVQYGVVVGEVLGVFGVAFVSPFTFLAIKWAYELRWYIVTDRSLRIRRGVWNVEELTMTFANIQEIRVQSGPVQRLLGLADVEVHAAGGGASVGKHGEEKSHKAVFEGVDNASEIRDLIVERLREYRELGLGGKGNQLNNAPIESSAAILPGLLEVREEAVHLRKALQSKNANH